MAQHVDKTGVPFDGNSQHSKPKIAPGPSPEVSSETVQSNEPLTHEASRLGRRTRPPLSKHDKQAELEKVIAKVVKQIEATKAKVDRKVCSLNKEFSLRNPSPSERAELAEMEKLALECSHLKERADRYRQAWARGEVGSGDESVAE